MLRVFIRSVLAGIMISIGAITYMNASAITGAFMFSVGLLSIFQFHLYLFTGLVPYVNKCGELPFILIVLAGNIIGACLMFAFPSTVAVDIVSNKITVPHFDMLISAVLCNIMIFIAVQANKMKNFITVILSVAAFIICGFNHSVANICFVISARMFTVDTLALIVVSLLGNAVGGIVFRKLVDYASSKGGEKLCS